MLVILLVISALYAYWLYNRYQSTWRHIDRFQGPMALPLLGNILQIPAKSEDSLRHALCMAKQYHYKPFRFYVGLQPYICISNPADLQTVLSNSTTLDKGDLYEFFYPWFGQGIFTANGNTWLSKRKVLWHTFQFESLKLFHMVNQTTDRFINLLDNYASSGQIFDMQELMSRCTLDVIYDCALGSQLNSIENGTSPLVNVIYESCYITSERIFSFFKRFDIFYNLTPLYRQQKKALQILEEEFNKIIENRRKILQTLKQNNSSSNIDPDVKRPRLSFLDSLLTARIDGKPLSDKEICDEVCTMVLTGHGTTSATIALAIYCLSRHSQIQERAFAEQFELFGTDNKRQPTYQEFLDMKYLEMIIKETMRLFPIAPLISRITTNPLEIDGKYVPLKTTLSISLISVSYDERYFEKPFEFRPERFGPDQSKSLTPYTFLPFSAGPRNCIGQKFAMVEMKCIMSKILRNFIILPPIDGLSNGIPNPFESDQGAKSIYDIKLGLHITMKSVNGIQIRLQKRDYKAA